MYWVPEYGEVYPVARKGDCQVRGEGYSQPWFPGSAD